MYRIVQQQEWTATMQWWPSVSPPLHKPLRIANPPQRGNHCGLQIRFSVVADCKSATAGIINSDTLQLTHTLHSIRRISRPT